MSATIDDPVLGLLIWDDEATLLGEIAYGCGTSESQAKVVPLVVFADPEAVDTTEVVARVREAFERFRANEGRYRLLSGQKLNKARWNDEEQLADEDVANLLRIVTLEFDSDGGLTVFWDDYDRLFGGHNVYTRIGADGTFLDAGML